MKANIEDLRDSMERMDRSIALISSYSRSIGEQINIEMEAKSEDAKLKSMVSKLTQELEELKIRNKELEAALPVALEKVDLAIEAVESVIESVS